MFVETSCDSTKRVCYIWVPLGAAVTGSFHPRDRKITDNQAQLYVDDSQAIAQDSPYDEVNGIYKEYHPVSASEFAMDRVPPTKWMLQGVWKRDSNPNSRYFLVFNRRSDTSTSQRWIITADTHPGVAAQGTPDIWRDNREPDVHAGGEFPIFPRILSESPEMRLWHANIDKSVQTDHDSRESQSVVETQNAQLHRTLSNHVDKITELQRQIDGYQQSQADLNGENQKLKEQIDELRKNLSDFETHRNELGDRENNNLKEKNNQLISELSEVREQTSQLVEDSNNHRKNTVILLCGGGAVLVLVVILCAVSHYRARSISSRKMEKVIRNQETTILKANEPLPVIPRVHAKRLRVNQHPAVRDQFGIKEIFDVTAGEGKDLVRIARPLETAGAERKLSEELMNIQPIIADREGAHSTTTNYSRKQTHDGENESSHYTKQCDTHKGDTV